MKQREWRGSYEFLTAFVLFIKSDQRMKIQTGFKEADSGRVLLKRRGETARFGTRSARIRWRGGSE